MKKSTLFFVTFLISLFTNGQACIRTGELVQTDVSLSGDVTLKFEGDSLVIQFASNFVTDAGPDLDVYLSNEPNPVATGIKIDPLKSFSGSQEYLVPSNIHIDDFKYIVVHCTQYNHLFGYALLGDKTGGCSGTVSVNDKSLLEKIWVSASRQHIYINNIYSVNNFQVKVYDLNGQTLYSNVGVNQFVIRQSGWLFVELYLEAERKVFRVFITE